MNAGWKLGWRTPRLGDAFFTSAIMAGLVFRKRIRKSPGLHLPFVGLGFENSRARVEVRYFTASCFQRFRPICRLWCERPSWDPSGFLIVTSPKGLNGRKGPSTNRAPQA